MFEREIRKFLDNICVELGFCLPPNKIKSLVARNFYEADSFVKEIFEIEGMDPDSELSLFRQVKKNFIDQFGSNKIP